MGESLSIFIPMAALSLRQCQNLSPLDPDTVVEGLVTQWVCPPFRWTEHAMGSWDLDLGAESEGVGFSWTKFPYNLSRFGFGDNDLAGVPQWSISALCGCWGLEVELGTRGNSLESQHWALQLLMSLSCPYAACIIECPEAGGWSARSYSRHSIWCAISDGDSHVCTNRRIPWERQATVHARFIDETLTVLDDEAREMAREKKLLASVIGHML